jgi:hypothetical protein
VKTALGAFSALLLAGAIYMPAAHAQVQPMPGFSVQVGPEAPPPSHPRTEEWREERLRQGFYGSGSEEWREERVREERRARDRCYRIRNPIERSWCFDDSR